MSVTATAYPPHMPEHYKVAGFRVLQRNRPGVFLVPMDQLACHELTIGRSDERDLRIHHRTVSRLHCVLTRNVNQQLVLTDARSKNKVMLAEHGCYGALHPITWRVVEVGDHFQIGNATLVAVDARGRCPLRIWSGPELIRHAIKLYGSEKLACKYLDISREALTAILHGDAS